MDVERERMRVEKPRVEIGSLKYTPLAMIVLFSVILFFYTSMNESNKIEFGNYGFDSEIGTYFSVFLAIAAVDILLIRMMVEIAKKDSKNILMAYVSTELPAIFGFALAILASNITFFYPFGLLSIVYYLYVHSQLKQIE